MYSRPSSYPYPPSFKNIKDVEEYQKKLYASLMENDRSGEFYRDRATPVDLKDMFQRPEWYGAKRDGVTNDSTAIQAAVTAAGENGCVLFSGGTYLVTTAITLPATNLTLIGSGFAVLDTSGTNSILKQTNHGALLRVDGIKFTGGGKGIEFASADEGTAHYEYDISNCVFAMDAGIYGIYIVGAREGTISNCYFQSGSGVYRSHSNICVISDCLFKGSDYTQTAVYDNGDGVAYSCGLQIKGSSILGYDIGVKASETDDIHIEGCTIDYNNHSIQLLGQDTGTITGNYLGSLAAEPAVEIDVSGAVRSGNLLISNNKFVGHEESGSYDCISIIDADYCQISGNYIAFYTRYGIYYHGCTVLSISHNDIIPRGGYGTNAIYTDEDNQSNKVCWNTYTTYGDTLGLAQEWENFTVGSARTSPVDYLTHADAQVSDLLTSGSPEFASMDVWGDTRIGTVDGSEMVVNGAFTSDAASWTASDCTLASVAGGQSGNCLEMTRTGGTFQTAAQTNAGFVVGHKYRYTVYVKSGTSGAEIAYLIARPDTATTDEYDTTGYATTSGTWAQITITFTATETSYDFYLSKGSATAGTMLFDTASAVELIPLVDAGYGVADSATMWNGSKMANSGINGSYTDAITFNLRAFPTSYGNSIASTVSSTPGQNGLKFTICNGNPATPVDSLILGDTHITMLLASIPTGANDAAAAAAGCAVGGLYRTNADPSVLCIRSA